MKVVHWRAHEARLLAPFYAFILHADEVADRYYKRLMRDLMHYPEEVYCKASQVRDRLTGNPNELKEGGIGDGHHERDRDIFNPVCRVR